VIVKEGTVANPSEGRTIALRGSVGRLGLSWSPLLNILIEVVDASDLFLHVKGSNRCQYSSDLTRESYACPQHNIPILLIAAFRAYDIFLLFP